MNTPILESVLNSLNEAKGGWREVSTATGVPYSTLCKIAQREIENPGVAHVQALYDHFRQVKSAA